MATRKNRGNPKLESKYIQRAGTATGRQTVRLKKVPLQKAIFFIVCMWALSFFLVYWALDIVKGWRR